MNELLEKTKALITSDAEYTSSNVSKIWPVTNENLKEVYNLFDVKNKDVLTITSSGDHILESIAIGAKTVDSFDINYLTKYYYYLKKAAIQSFDPGMFVDVIGSLSCGIFKSKNYRKICENLGNDDKIFWDKIINCCKDVDNAYLINLFNTIAKKTNFGLLSYMEPKNYDFLKEKLKYSQVGFFHSDIFSLDTKLDKTYNFIYLSNVYKYTDKYSYTGINKVKQYAKNRLYPYLNDGGAIVYAYLYGYSFDHFNNLYTIKDVAEEYYPIDGTYGKKDCLFTLKK